MKDLLSSAIRLVPIIKAVFPFDCMMAISDKEKYIFYLPGIKIKHDSPIGQDIQKGDGLWEAINNKQVHINIIYEIWGSPIKVITTPIVDEQELVIGALSLAYYLEDESNAHYISNGIPSSSEGVLASSKVFSCNYIKSDEYLNKLSPFIKSAVKNLEKSDQIDTIVQLMKIYLA